MMLNSDSTSSYNILKVGVGLNILLPWMCLMAILLRYIKKQMLIWEISIKFV